MSSERKGRGSWLLSFVERKYGRKAAQEIEERRVTQGQMPELDVIVFKGPEFDFRDITPITHQSHH